MNSIVLDNTLPNVFLGRGDTKSDIWRQHVTLEKGKTYLVDVFTGVSDATSAHPAYRAAPKALNKAPKGAK